MFDQLPVEMQNEPLPSRWDKIAGPNMLSILRRYAQTYRDFPEMREMNAHKSLQLSASGLQHWYELDPAGARPAIIREITRFRPRFDARVLGRFRGKPSLFDRASFSSQQSWNGCGRRKVGQLSLPLAVVNREASNSLSIPSSKAPLHQRHGRIDCGSPFPSLPEP
jgi:hypothetical protein